MKHAQTFQPRGPTVLDENGVDLNLAAGGMKGFEHIGVIEEILAAGIVIRLVTGVSVGAIIATFLSNGFSPKRIKEIFIKGLAGHNNPLNALICISFPDPFRFMVGGSMMDLTPAIRQMVAEFDLKPNKHLRIIACDYLTGKPVVFEGENYDLAMAMAASCSYPGMFLPIWHTGDNGERQLLVDGAMYHHSPPDFSTQPAIFSTFRKATKMPTDWQAGYEEHFANVQNVMNLTLNNPWMPFYHMNLWLGMCKAFESGMKLAQNWSLPIDLMNAQKEIDGSAASGGRFVDPDKHLVIESGLADVPALYYSASPERIEAMGKDGRLATRRALRQAQKEGRIKLRYGGRRSV